MNDIEWMEEWIDHWIRRWSLGSGDSTSVTEVIGNLTPMRNSDRWQQFQIERPTWLMIPHEKRKLLARECIKRFVKSGRVRVFFSNDYPCGNRLQSVGILDTLASL